MSCNHSTGLRHAYGPAGDIPGLLGSARRAPAPADYRDEPWYSLWNALCHQGDVYTASYAAVPALVAIAEARRDEPAVLRECLLLAGTIELERALPHGAAPPAMPDHLRPAYAAALADGAALAEAALARELDPEPRETLALSRAALGGDAAEARRIADGPDAEEAGAAAPAA